MSTYLLLYSGGDQPETDAETKAVTDAWGRVVGWHRGRARGRQPLLPQREESLARRSGL